LNDVKLLFTTLKKLSVVIKRKSIVKELSVVIKRKSIVKELSVVIKRKSIVKELSIIKIEKIIIKSIPHIFINKVMMSNTIKSFLSFLSNVGINLQIYGPYTWTHKSILKTSRIILRSRIDLLSGNYKNFDEYIQHLDSVVIDDPLVSARGETCPAEIYDEILLSYNNFENNNIIPPYPFPYEMPVLRCSCHLIHFITFLQSLGLRDKNYYLLTRSWFGRNPELQMSTLQVALQGNANKINVKSDFNEQINSLLCVT
jgi:hypothetical protein